MKKEIDQRLRCQSSEFSSQISMSSGNLYNANEQTLRCVSMLRSMIALALLDASNGEVDALRWIRSEDHSLHGFDNIAEMASVNPTRARKMLSNGTIGKYIAAILKKKDGYKISRIVRDILPVE